MTLVDAEGGFCMSEESKTNVENIEPFTQMTSKELFVILTGGEGLMKKMYLQKILETYLRRHGDYADLVTMVRTVAEEEPDGQDA